MRASGKTTLFNALTGADAPMGTFSHTSNAGAMLVPDDRVDLLADIEGSKKRVHASMDLVDVPGLATPDSAEHDQNPQVLAHIRQADALMIVLRTFESPVVANPLGETRPSRDLDEIMTEFIIADTEIAEGRRDRLRKAQRHGGAERETAVAELHTLEVCLEALNNAQPISSLELSADMVGAIRSFGFLTAKPALVVVNTGEESVDRQGRFDMPAGMTVLPICAKLEMEIDQLDPEDRPDFMRELGIDQAAKDRIALACYDLLGYHTFLTGSDKEARAWALRKGADALEAAGRIHTDFARGFIKAEVVHMDDLKDAGSMREAKARHAVRLEGKHYVVQDGDVILFRFNV